MNVDWRQLTNAPAPGTVICALQALEVGVVREFRFASQAENDPAFALILHRHRDEVNAYVNQCPHHWLPMNRSDGKFLMWSETQLMCTHHSAVFTLTDAGHCIMGPCQGSNLIRVPVRVVDGQIEIAADGSNA